MAVIDNNKLKIVEAGALPLYVKLLSPGCNESVQAEAADGLWSLAFKCKKQINKQQGCLEGHCLYVITTIVLVRIVRARYC